MEEGGGTPQLRTGAPPDVTHSRTASRLGRSDAPHVGGRLWDPHGLGSQRHEFQHAVTTISPCWAPSLPAPPLCSPCRAQGTAPSRCWCRPCPWDKGAGSSSLLCVERRDERPVGGPWRGALPPLLLTSLRLDCQDAGNTGAHAVSQDSSRRPAWRCRDSAVLPAHSYGGRRLPPSLKGPPRPSCCSCLWPCAPGAPGALQPHRSLSLPMAPGPVPLLCPLRTCPPLISAPGCPQGFAQMPPFVVPSSPSHLKLHPAGLLAPLVCPSH